MRPGLGHCPPWEIGKAVSILEEGGWILVLLHAVSQGLPGSGLSARSQSFLGPSELPISYRHAQLLTFSQGSGPEGHKTPKSKFLKRRYDFQVTVLPEKNAKSKQPRGSGAPDPGLRAEGSHSPREGE